MDARVRYTKRVIKEAIIDLMEEKHVDKITVKEICDKAMINRATFYKHYDNTNDLLDKLESEMLEELEKELADIDLADLRNLFEILLNNIKENNRYYEIVILETGDKRFREKMFELCILRNMEVINKFFPSISEAQKVWLYYFLAEGISGIIKKWMKEGYKESIVDVVEFIATLVEGVNNTVRFKVG